jgi:hypothetical protein
LGEDTNLRGSGLSSGGLFLRKLDWSRGSCKGDASATMFRSTRGDISSRRRMLEHSDATGRERLTLRLSEDALLDARLQGTVELNIECRLRDRADLVVCLNVFLDGLSAVRGRSN